MNFITFLFVPILIFAKLRTCWSYQESDELLVKINDGEILGRYITSESGRTISAFMGIPFAAPPVGDLRFRGPQKAIPWDGTLFCQTEPQKCPQIDSFWGSTVFEGDEDCLYLSVYVPEKTTVEQLDVIVWIHGGAFVLGNGGLSSYGPDYLLDHDVILVSGNYRLNLLGFLSTEDQYCPGNFGLKDQSFLLQWVQDNIHHFGGNKDSVTIWGESAGAASVHYHMISPMSSGRFHKAILNSGSLNNAWSDPARSGVAKEQAIKLAEHVNCAVENKTSEEIVECLRGISAEDIVNFVSSGPYPVIESFESDEAFIGERNFDELSANSIEIPCLLGINSEESLLTLASILSNNLSLDYLISIWNIYLPNALGYGHLSLSQQEEITVKINSFYFGNGDAPNNQVDRNSLINLFTDGSFIGLVETIKHRLGYSNHQSTYLYLFTHKGTSSFSTSATEFLGTTHADDLIPLFPIRKVAFYSAIPTEQDKELTRVMSLMWTNFARTGNPTPNNSTIPLDWPMATGFPLNYMQIGNENGKFDSQILQRRVDFLSARANFWMELRQEYRFSSWLDGNSSPSSRYSLSLVGFLLLFCFINY